MSANSIFPNLAGQHDAYLIEALKAYQSGARDNVMMAATVKALSEADMGELARHFAALTLNATSVAGGNADLAAGKAKAAACAGCHGANGVSVNPAWPSLAGQKKDYLIAALKAYRDGARKNPVMAGMAKGLSDADVDILAAYFSSARSN